MDESILRDRAFSSWEKIKHKFVGNAVYLNQMIFKVFLILNLYKFVKLREKFDLSRPSSSSVK